MTKYIFIAEDDEEDVELFREAILNTGLPIVLTWSVYCEGIIKSVSTEPVPDIIIVDGNLPGMSLFECIAEIKSHEKLHKSPIVVLSGSGFRATKENIYNAGINLFLEKPSDYQVLEDLFRRLFLIDWTADTILTSEQFYAMDL